MNSLLQPNKKRKLVCTKKASSGTTGIRCSSNLFKPTKQLVTVRAPIMTGLSIRSNTAASSAGLYKPFQRPMTKRRSYDNHANQALKAATLGPKKRMDGMAKLMARAGRGLLFRTSTKDDDNKDRSDDEDEQEPKKEPTWEPLCVWQSPHEGGPFNGLPDRVFEKQIADEFGIEHLTQVQEKAPLVEYNRQSVYVPPVLCKWLRPHQREGVQFMYECTMSLRDFDGAGCILADDMGLGKTLQSISLLYTLLKTSIPSNTLTTAKRVIIVCPCSLVKNWDNEINKWIANGGPTNTPTGIVPPRVMALAECDKATIEKNLDSFCRTNIYSILIASYECIRSHVGRITSYKESKCDLLICDEAHRLKNRDNQTTRALHSLPCKRRVLLTGTPMQNDLEEFYAMVDFCNPNILGSSDEFRKRFLLPILRGREPDATERQKSRMMECQQELSEIVNQFILRRVNTLNAEHLPPKLVQVVCINLTDTQRNMYEFLLSKIENNKILEGKSSNALGWIQLLMKLANHPRLVADEDPMAKLEQNKSRRTNNNANYKETDTGCMTESLCGVSKFLPYDGGYQGNSMMGRHGGSSCGPVRPELSGKMFVLWRLMTEMRKPYCRDKIVIVSNYTQTLDLIGKMCLENGWPFCRLDGSIGMKKRQKMVDEFNDLSSNLVAFLLSSKAGGCGLNLVGGNRLVLFDPDWNPAVDKQAAARCWRDGQKKRCFTYRFLATGTVEEKIFQRQLSKEGLQSVVDDKEQVNALSTKDLRNLFKLRTTSPSDTHDKLDCKRCQTIQENSEAELAAILPLQLAECRTLLQKLCAHEDATKFLTPLNPLDHEGGITKEMYDRIVKQPMDLGTIQSKMNAPSSSKESYKSPSHFAKDVNRIFSNVLKVWNAGQDIAEASRRLQGWWVDHWGCLVPKIMSIKLGAANNKEKTDNDLADKENNENNQQRYPVESERGEDFQEQIGLPDEENMRSWSHHFSSDTCDDPVFRTAMNGYDHVSFVFGLEVTWSLIQQRQQEEEEKIAMEELQRISTEELSREEASYLADQESTEKVTRNEFSELATNSEDADEEWTLEKVYNLEEIEKGLVKCSSTSTCRLNACSIWKSNLGEECSACLGCQDSQFGGWPVGLTPPAELLSCIQIYCTASSEEKHLNNDTDARHETTITTSIPQDAEVKQNKGGEWSCGMCTFLNPEKSKKCSACYSKKPKL